MHLRVRAAPPRGGRERYAGPDSEVAGAVTDQEGRWQSEALPASAGPQMRARARDDASRPCRASSRPSTRSPSCLCGRKCDEDRPIALRHDPEPDRTAGRRRNGHRPIEVGPDDARAHPVRPRTGGSAPGPLSTRNGESSRWWSRLTDSPRRRNCCSSQPRSHRSRSGSRRASRCTAAWSTRMGRPVAGAIVMSPREFGYAGLDWEAETDPVGRFVWYEAPVTRQLHAQCRQAAVPANRGPHGRGRGGRDHADVAPPAARARHGHRRRDRPADRTVCPHLRLRTTSARLAAGLAPKFAPFLQRRQVRPDRSRHRAGRLRLDPDRGRGIRASRIPQVPRQPGGRRARFPAQEGRTTLRDRPWS